MKRQRAGEEEDEEKESGSISPKRAASEFAFSELLGKYDVKCELGRGKTPLTLGSYGTVYKAMNLSTGERVAIKRLLPTMHGNFVLMEVLFMVLLK